MDTAVNAGYSMTNICFGMGGARIQDMSRDTLKFAYKCSWAQVNGQERDVFKDPITDPGKKSKAGKLDLIYDCKEIKTVKYQPNNKYSLMRTVFENGKLLVDDSLDMIRNRIHF